MTFGIFFCGRTEDSESMGRLKENLEKELPNLEFEDLSLKIPNHEGWKTEAEPLLEECSLVVCLVGKNTHESENVSWELNKGKELGKPLLFMSISEADSLPELCKRESLKVLPWKCSSFAGSVAEALVPHALFGCDNSECRDEPTGALWNQYNLMVQSSEQLVTRRQTVNSLYLSASAALLAAIGVLISNIESVSLLGVASGATLLGLLGVAISSNWRRTIISYGILNKAKFKVIEAMEELMPAKIFDVEWLVLEARSYKSTTDMDRQTANFIIFLFSLVVLVGIGVLFSEVSST